MLTVSRRKAKGDRGAGAGRMKDGKWGGTVKAKWQQHAPLIGTGIGRGG